MTDNRCVPLAYLPEEADLRHLFPDWPAGMRVALCMDPAGACLAVPFRAEEEAAVPARAARALGTPLAALAVAPERNGQTTLPMVFSDEQRLLAILEQAGAERLTEFVRDYALNYMFAQEEGLPPDQLLGEAVLDLAERAEDGAATDPGHVIALPVPADPEVPAAAIAWGEDPGGETPAHPALGGPPGFFSLAGRAVGACGLGRGSLQGDPDGTVVTLRPAGADGPARDLLPADVFLRDDLAALALRLPDGLPGDATFLRLPADRLPSPLRARMAKGALPVRLSWTEGFLHVALDALWAAPATETSAGAVPPRPSAPPATAPEAAKTEAATPVITARQRLTRLVRVQPAIPAPPPPLPFAAPRTACLGIGTRLRRFTLAAMLAATASGAIAVGLQAENAGRLTLGALLAAPDLPDAP